MRISRKEDRHVFSTAGETTIHNEHIRYTVISEETFLEIEDGKEEGPNMEDAKPAASMFSFTYLRTDTNTKSDEAAGPAAVTESRQSRPVLFIFNGGPGSSSHLMHLGFFGPERVKLQPDGALPTVPPFEMEENPHCLLDAFDLVLIDPPATGYGQLLDPAAKDQFFGTDQDAMAFVLFIEDWLTRYNRWNSPRYLCGESYGTMRCAVLADALMGGVSSRRFSCITVNGLILMGSTFHIEGVFEELHAEPAVLNMMSYAAANRYHHPKDGETPASFAEEAWKFSVSDYAHALLMGDYLSAEEKERIIEKLQHFTGMPAAWFREHGLRPGKMDFLQQVVRSRGLEAGGYDSRVTLPLSDQIGSRDAFDDPSMAASNPAYASLINVYLKEKLGISLERNYITTNVEASITWAYGSSRTPCECLAAVTRRSKSMRILFASGLYDLCTPAGYARYIIAQAGLPQDRVVRREYEGGHMIYTREAASAALERDIRQFVG